MGFDPLKDKVKRCDSLEGTIDDTPRPYSKLTPEEFDYVYDYYFAHKNDSELLGH
jgi:hypothetical protein